VGNEEVNMEFPVISHILFVFVTTKGTVFGRETKENGLLIMLARLPGSIIFRESFRIARVSDDA